MKTIEDDPRITAYVLGELGPRDRAALEQEIAADPALARLVEEFRAGARLLGEVLPQEAADLGLSLAQREQVWRAVAGELPDQVRSRRWGGMTPWPAAWGWAACLTLIGLMTWMWLDGPTEGPGRHDVLETGGPAPAPAVSALQRQESAAKADPRTEQEFRRSGNAVPGDAGAGVARDNLAAAASAPSAPPPPVAEPAGREASRRVDGRVDAMAGVEPAGPPARRMMLPVHWAPEARAKAAGETYLPLTDHPFRRVTDVVSATSTFGADVDTASYANIRRFLRAGQWPPREAVRIEEVVNAFTYDYPAPERGQPFAASVEVASAPWAPQHRLVRIGLRAREIPVEERPPMNLVFLVDVSGSMAPANRLPLVQQSLRLITRGLLPHDRVAIVTYAGDSRVALESTGDRRRMLRAIDQLQAGGSTNGEGGILMAYQIARAHFIEGGVNRVILCTDGDFNVGTTSRDELIALVERERASGVYFSVYGFGMGNLKEATLEQLANRGNGTYGYIDSYAEAVKTFVRHLGGALVPVAKDVKFQVEFNPARVAAWRQIGYENRQLDREDFQDDSKDAGEVGSGHVVTALYEIIPTGVASPALPEPHRYVGEGERPGSRRQETDAPERELLFVKIRHKLPGEETSRLTTFPVRDTGGSWERASQDFRFTAAVAGFGMILRESPHRGGLTWDLVEQLARSGRGEDLTGDRAEFLQLMALARALKP